MTTFTTNELATIDTKQLTAVTGGRGGDDSPPGVGLKIKKAAACVGAAAAVCLGPHEPDMESVPRFPTIENTGSGTTTSQQG